MCTKVKHYYIAQPHGMCGGVRRALEIVEANWHEPLYILNEIVHNSFIVDSLGRHGVTTVKSLLDVPTGSTVVFSAHGVSKKVENEAKERGLKIIDATCPLVKKLHKAVAESVESGEFTVLLGHATHPEVVGTMGQLECGRVYIVEDAKGVNKLPETTQKVRLLTQTTLDTELVEEVGLALKARYGEQLCMDSGVCFATRERQEAVRKIAGKVELMLVIGSAHSSNSNRLREVAEHLGCRALLIERGETLDIQELDGVTSVGISAGASAPDILLQELITLLQKNGFACGAVE